MLATNTTYITDHQGKTLSAVVPINEFNEMLKIVELYENLYEDLEDVKLYQKAKEEKYTSEPMETVFNRIEQKRKHNGKE